MTNTNYRVSLRKNMKYSYEKSRRKQPSGSNMTVLSKLKEIRKSKGLTLEKLGKEINLSANYLSQIERGLANPSVAVLKRITKALGIQYMSLAEGEAGLLDASQAVQSPVRLVRQGRRKTLVYPGGGRQASLLTADLQGKLEVIITVEEPEPERNDEWYSHEGEEFGLVLEGCYEVTVADQTYFMEEGDSICFPSSLPHRMRNPGTTHSKTLWVITPPSF